MSPEISTAHLAASTAPELAAAADAAVARGRAGIARLKEAAGASGRGANGRGTNGSGANGSGGDGSRTGGDEGTGAVGTTTGMLTGDAAIHLLDIYDEAMADLNNTVALIGMIGKAHPDEAMLTAANEAIQVIASELVDVSLDPGVYAALTALDVSGQDEATRYYLARTLRDFRRSGVDRDDQTRSRVRALQEEIITVGLAFDRNIRGGMRSATFPASALDGLPDDYVRAHEPGEDGLVTITTEYPDVVPFLAYSRDAGARERIWKQFRSRAYPENVVVLRQMLELRHELATLLGYPNWAQYITEDKMIGTEKAAADFIASISDVSATRADREYGELLRRKRLDEPEATAVYPWDVTFLQDRLKAEKLAFDTQAVRPYFEYTRVKNGLMALIEQMLGITFRRRTDLPVWHSDVEVYDVFQGGHQGSADPGGHRGSAVQGGPQGSADPGGDSSDDPAPIGRIFLDMHPRPGKYSHAAMFLMRTGKLGSSPETSRIPEGALLCNLPRPGDEPALLQHNDVATFFHEFGHLIHHVIAGRQRWSGIAGIANEWDFVEAPSQLLEEWTFDAATLAPFAVHHETGEPLPVEYVEKLRAAAEFGKGMQVRQQMYYAALSLELYRRDPAGLDPATVDRETLEKYTPYTYPDDTHMHLSFGHLDGYTAMYYTYMWSLVIAKDLFTRFADEGLPAPIASAAYRDSVLAPGGSAPAGDLVRSFLGREYTFDAYRRWLDA